MRTAAAGLYLICTLFLFGCSKSHESVITVEASRYFAQADSVRFTDLRPGHREELILSRRRVLEVVTESVAGATPVPKADGAIVGRIQVMDGSRLLADYYYHEGGILESADGNPRFCFRPLPAFHVALVAGSHREFTNQESGITE